MNFSLFQKVAVGLFAGICFAGTLGADEIQVSEGVSRTNLNFDPLQEIGEIKNSEVTETQTSDDASVPALEMPTLDSTAPVVKAEPEKPAATLPEPHRRFLFDYTLPGFSQNDYSTAVADLFAAYEKNTGRSLAPGEKKKVALKIYTASGKGLATPQALTRAVRDALEARGFVRENIILVDLNEKALRKSGYLPPFRRGKDTWEGCPVFALDTGKFYNRKWFLENPLPSREAFVMDADEWSAPENDRKSFLPKPLLFDVDFWINLPVATDSAVVGVSAALANATLWNVSNQRRFLENPANAAVAAVSIATIPEFKAKFELTLLSLEKYQFIGGPNFYAEYTTSENRLWMSANPVILDYLLWQRMNTLRTARGFEPILPEPPVFAMASKGSVSLGSCVNTELTLVELPETQDGK